MQKKYADILFGPANLNYTVGRQKCQSVICNKFMRID
jgi:hypothetical protein